MKIIGILLIVLAVAGGLMASLMYGDIGIAALIGALTSLLSGIGLLRVNKAIKDLKNTPA